MQSQRISRVIVLSVVMLSGCSKCSVLHHQVKFNGFITTQKAQTKVSNSGGTIDIQTPDVGVVQVKIPPGAILGDEKVEVITGPNNETDEEFQSHPYTADLQKMVGEVRIVLGKSLPGKPLELCFKKERLFKGQEEGELLSLVHEFYDGENETLTYFFSVDRHPTGDSECLELAPDVFSNLDNSDGRFETFVVFAKKNKEK